MMTLWVFKEGKGFAFFSEWVDIFSEVDGTDFQSMFFMNSEWIMGMKTQMM